MSNIGSRIIINIRNPAISYEMAIYMLSQSFPPESKNFVTVFKGKEGREYMLSAELKKATWHVDVLKSP